jgi:hypothetical protein
MIGGHALRITPLELQIADKLHLGSRRDIEDAVHIFTVFEESLRATRLEKWVTRLGVEDEYERLKRA